MLITESNHKKHGGTARTSCRANFIHKCDLPCKTNHLWKENLHCLIEIFPRSETGALPAGPREEMPSAVSKGLAVLGRDVLTCVHRAGKTEVAAHEMH